MNYTYKIENLDCANCAVAVESAVLKINGIKSCSVNFFALKMILATESEMTEDLFKKIQKAAKRVELGIKLKAV